tara:strand:+ start:756 stop:1133 length:378 start_codon:yes stop_codon:yes gene_type:complete
MPFATNAPTIKEMLAAVDAGTATLAEVAVVANNRLAREGKADGWYARYNELAAKCVAGEAVTVADVFPAKPAKVAVNPLRDDLPVAPVAPAQDWKALTDAVLAAAPNATTAQVAAFASKLIRANG